VCDTAVHIKIDAGSIILENALNCLDLWLLLLGPEDCALTLKYAAQ
jgi:hypothetical protein